MTERTEDAQAQALRAFLLLCALAPEWQGSLILVRGLDPSGRAASIASMIAGAACLAIDAHPEVCRAALRAGACDFMVNSVDEALRVLKNEIRKRRPVGVALCMPEDAALAELADRGVVPQVFLSGAAGDSGLPAARFSSFGTRVLSPPDAERVADEYIHTHGLELRELQFSSPQELSAFDQRLSSTVSKAEPRLRWAAGASKFFYRDRPIRRIAAMTEAEWTALTPR